jgi:DNA-binding transcriptional regulator YhcF (GntR family)
LQERIRIEKAEEERKRSAKTSSKKSPERSELEKKVESLLDQGYNEEAILSALLALSHKEHHIKRALAKIKKERKQKTNRNEFVSEKESKIRTEVDDIFYTIKVEEKISIADLAAKMKMQPEQLKKWLEYLEKDGLITIKCRFGGKEFVKIKEEF